MTIPNYLACVAPVEKDRTALNDLVAEYLAHGGQIKKARD